MTNTLYGLCLSGLDSVHFSKSALLSLRILQYYTGVNERENWNGQERSKIETKAATTQGKDGDAGSDH